MSEVLLQKGAAVEAGSGSLAAAVAKLPLECP